MKTNICRRAVRVCTSAGRTGTVWLAGCAAGTALAQSTVGISGYLDIGAYRAFDGTRHVGTIQRSSITFFGNEDLGDGYHATFRLSHRLEMGTGQPEGAGQKPFWHGESTVGVRAPWGAVRLGRALDVLYANDWKYDPWGHFDRIASPAWNNWHRNYSTDRTSNNGTLEKGRLRDGVFYVSPTWSGWRVDVTGAFESRDPLPNAGKGRSLGASLHYDQGPVSLMAARSKNSSQDVDDFLGARYSFGAVTVMGAWDRSVLRGTNDSVARAWTLGATYTAGLWTFKAGAGQRDVGGVRADFIGLGTSYALSKRTTAYISAGNDRPKATDHRRAYGVGLTHTF